MQCVARSLGRWRHWVFKPVRCLNKPWRNTLLILHALLNKQDIVAQRNFMAFMACPARRKTAAKAGGIKTFVCSLWVTAVHMKADASSNRLQWDWQWNWRSAVLIFSVLLVTVELMMYSGALTDYWRFEFSNLVGLLQAGVTYWTLASVHFPLLIRLH